MFIFSSYPLFIVKINIFHEKCYILKKRVKMTFKQKINILGPFC